MIRGRCDVGPRSYCKFDGQYQRSENTDKDRKKPGSTSTYWGRDTVIWIHFLSEVPQTDPRKEDRSSRQRNQRE